MLPRLIAALSLGAALLVAVPATPASAAVIARDDTFLVYAGGTYTLDPLANDDTFLGSGELTVCGLRGGDPQRAYAAIEAGAVVVEVVPGHRGTLKYTYDACQGSGDRRSATITLEVDALDDLTARRKPATRGKVVVRNPNPVPVRVAWGSATTARPDAARTVPAVGSVTISTKRRSLYWVGTYSDDGVLLTVGDGVLRGLQTRPRR